jgi:hypothetical protein
MFHSDSWEGPVADLLPQGMSPSGWQGGATLCGRKAALSTLQLDPLDAL